MSTYSLYDVYRITEYRNGHIYKSHPTGSRVWVRLDLCLSDNLPDVGKDMRLYTVPLNRDGYMGPEHFPRTEPWFYKE